MRKRELLLVGLIALVGAFVIVRLVPRPTYTDSFYHFNAAVRLAAGSGLTDEYVWTYIGQPAQSAGQVVPSHLYWMPLTSILTGVSMALFNAPGNYTVAQIPLILLFAGTVIVGYTLGAKLGGTRRHALTTAALTLCSGFFTKFWGEIDTFAAYAFAGSLCLLALGYGVEKRDWRWFGAAGVMAGFGHLTRSDGLLLYLVGVLIIVTAPVGAHADAPDTSPTRKFVFMALTAFTLAYLLIMGGWFVRMVQITGSPLPVGGLQAAWFTEYDDLFRYPPDADVAELFDQEFSLFSQTRWIAFIQNLQTFLFVEGYIVLMPLMLIGLWRTRSGFTLAVILFAVGIHTAMTLVFPYPGWRGGLLHGVAALIPWWAAFAVVGVDTAVDWIAKRRRNWSPAAAKRIFSAALVLLAVMLTVTNMRGIPHSMTIPASYATLVEQLPDNARVLINDPSQFYYYTGIGGAVLPNESPEVIAEIASRYSMTHVVIEAVREIDGQSMSSAIPKHLQSILTAPPPFLEPIDIGIPGMRVFRIAL